MSRIGRAEADIILDSFCYDIIQLFFFIVKKMIMSIEVQLREISFHIIQIIFDMTIIILFSHSFEPITPKPSKMRGLRSVFSDVFGPNRVT